MFGRWTLRGSFSVDAYSIDFRFHCLKTNQKVCYLNYFSQEEGLRCLLTNDPVIEQDVVAKIADFKATTTALLEARGEKVELGMIKHLVTIKPPHEDESFTVYFGPFVHDFKYHGRYVGVVVLLLDSGGGGSKNRRRRRKWQRIEWPEVNLPDLFPYPTPA